MPAKTILDRVTQEPCRDIAKAALSRRYGIKAVRQHSPTRRRFMGTKRVILFRKGVTHEPCERCAAFMPLQCGICEGIRSIPMLLDVPTLGRNKFRGPRFMVAKRVKFRKGAAHPCRGGVVNHSRYRSLELFTSREIKISADELSSY